MPKDEDAPDAAREARWHRVYITVIIFTAFLITALWLFSHTFSN